ncbi:MAG: alpha/beta hydrolase [Pseudomonadota bacterium]
MNWLAQFNLPASLLSFGLKLTTKRMLARVQDPAVLRGIFARSVRRLARHPAGALGVPIDLPTGATGEPRTREGLWVTAHGEGWRPQTPVADPADTTPVILYFHGGAFIAGSPQTHRHLAAALAGAAGGHALMPDYRLAPEHRLPAALEDARAAWDWLMERGFAPSRIALAGDSAGGGLALSLLADLTADRAALPAAVVAFSPFADLRGEAGSITQNAGRDAMLPAHRFNDLIDFCLGEGGDREDWRVSPVLATFRAPPPTMIFASLDEILLDDAIAMTERLRTAGSDPELEIRRGLPHAWPVFRGWLAAADADILRAGQFIARHTGR